MTRDLDGSFGSAYACAGYRLPTEAEWEYAARAGSTGAFENGANIVSGTETSCAPPIALDDGSQLGDMAWYCGSAEGRTQDVGLLEPNGHGLYDVHGSAWEWCHDWYGSYPATVTDPVGAASGSDRVRRGGSWSRDARFARVAVRSNNDPGDRYSALGFRLSR